MVIYGQPAKFDKKFPRNDYPEYLEKLISRFGIQDQVELKPYTSDPLSVLAEADIFALPSKTEGFPVALTEAMSTGLPCVGLKTASGVNELIIDGQTGLLAESTPEDLGQKLKRLMNNPNLRFQLGDQARRYVAQFTPESVWELWDCFIRQTLTMNLKRHSSIKKP